MKKVFNTSSDVIHLFAQRTQDEARCSNVFFDNKNKIYSYGHHYLLAEFLDDNTVLINDVGYSVTTSKHISEAKWALSQYKQFYTSYCDIKYAYNSVIGNKSSLANAKKPELYIQPILRTWEKLNEFIVYNKNKTIKKTKEYKTIKTIVKALEQPEEYKEKLHLLAIKQAKTAKIKASKEKKIQLQKFMNYEINYFRINGVNDHVRVSRDGKSIETSQNISVNIKDAKKLYLLIKAGRSVKGYQIDNYTVISINGTLKIGCHNIDVKNMKEVGELILKS